jgi:carnosine N-methyltransferase
MDENEMELERQHHINVLKAFGAYQKDVDTKLTKYRRDFESLPEEDRALLQPKYPQKLEVVQACAQVNQKFLLDSVKGHLEELMGVEINDAAGFPRNFANEREQENLRSLLRQLVRDWSDEGKDEREASYAPIMRLLDSSFPSSSSRENIRVLVPGAGLGRLVYEIAHAGFDCQGNDFSLFMLFPCQFMLNGHLKPKSYQIHPWILPFSNHCSVSSQIRAIPIPDILVEPPASGEMSMTAGDFLQIYGVPEEEASWDAVVSCFFLDTAKNVVQYIRTFHALLKPGGVWINHGPLLYHFEGSSEVSIELSFEEVVDVAEKIGFKMECATSTVCPYAQDPSSMYQTGYRCRLVRFIKTC